VLDLAAGVIADASVIKVAIAGLRLETSDGRLPGKAAPGPQDPVCRRHDGGEAEGAAGRGEPGRARPRSTPSCDARVDRAGLQQTANCSMRFWQLYFAKARSNTNLGQRVVRLGSRLV